MLLSCGVTLGQSLATVFPAVPSAAHGLARCLGKAHDFRDGVCEASRGKLDPSNSLNIMQMLESLDLMRRAREKTGRLGLCKLCKLTGAWACWSQVVSCCCS